MCRRAASSGSSPSPSESILVRDRLPAMAAGLPAGRVSLSCQATSPVRILTMQHVRAGSMLIRFSAFALVAALATFRASPGFEQARADESPAYVVEGTDVSAKVGEPAVLHASLRIRDGYRILQGYNNRVIELSSFDDGVAV